MAHELDETIEALKTAIEDLRAPMAAAHARFVEAAGSWAGEFWRAHAKNVVVANPDLAKQHSADGTLRKLRADIAALVEVAHDHAAQAFGQEALAWPHNADDLLAPDRLSYSGWSRLRPSQSSRGPAAPEVLEAPSARLLGLVASSLQQHGYPATAQRHGSRGSYSTWDAYEYHHHSWSEAMAERLLQYANLHITVAEKREELQQCLRTRAAAEAESAWDDAA